MLDERLELGPEQQRIAEVRVVQRLLAETITRQDELVAFGVPEREREHAAQPVETPPPVSSYRWTTTSASDPVENW